MNVGKRIREVITVLREKKSIVSVAADVETSQNAYFRPDVVIRRRRDSQGVQSQGSRASLAGDINSRLGLAAVQYLPVISEHELVHQVGGEYVVIGNTGVAKLVCCGKRETRHITTARAGTWPEV